MLYVFVFDVLPVLFVSSLHNDIALFYVSVLLFVTRLGGFILAFCGLVSFCCFVLKCCFRFPFLSTKKPKRDTAKKNKKQKCRKTPQNLFAVSAIVLPGSVPKFLGWALNMQFVAENTLQIVVSAFFAATKNG